MKAIIDKIFSLNADQMFTGVSFFEGFKLKSINLQTV